MQVFVKAAHSSLRYYFSREIVARNILKHSDAFEPSLVIPALKAALDPLKDNVEADGKGNVEENICMLNQAIDNICSAKNRHILHSCVYSGLCREEIRHSVDITAAPTLKVGSLKSVLKRESWIPAEDLMLVKDNEKSLTDDENTLEEVGIEDQATLLACMGGSFDLTVSGFDGSENFTIPIDSCFDTVGIVKEKIHQKTGHRPSDQELYCNVRSRLENDDISLVSVGIVRPYLPGMLMKIYLAVLPRI